MPISYILFQVYMAKQFYLFWFSQHYISVWQIVIIMKPDCEKEGEGELFRFMFVTCIK